MRVSVSDDDEDNEWEKCRAAAEAFIAPMVESHPKHDGAMGALHSATYAFSEMNIFGDISVDAELAIRIWALVETVRRSGFPDELRV